MQALDLVRPPCDRRPTSFGELRQVMGLAGEADRWRSHRARRDHRHSAHREWTLTAKGTKSQVSPGERELFVKTRQLLSNELALARGVEPAEANAWIDEQLTRMADQPRPQTTRDLSHPSIVGSSSARFLAMGWSSTAVRCAAARNGSSLRTRCARPRPDDEAARSVAAEVCDKPAAHGRGRGSGEVLPSLVGGFRLARPARLSVGPVTDGRSPVLTSSASGRSTGAPPASAHRSRSGARRPACTR
jgi:hypothetical protein